MTAQLKRKLAEQEPVLVINVNHPAAGLVEALGRLPVDAVFFDCEQGSPGIESVENMARAARLAGIPSLCRLHGPEDWLIERYLFRGINGIVIPRLDRGEQAAGVVEAVRYCLPELHKEIAIVVQIESGKAVEDLTAFLSVEGIDCMFLGPVDLAKSMGFGGDFNHPEVQTVIDDTITRIVKAGKTAGMLVTRETVAEYHKKGVRFFYEHVNTVLSYGIDAFWQKANSGR